MASATVQHKPMQEVNYAPPQVVLPTTCVQQLLQKEISLQRVCISINNADMCHCLQYETQHMMATMACKKAELLPSQL